MGVTSASFRSPTHLPKAILPAVCLAFAALFLLMSPFPCAAQEAVQLLVIPGTGDSQDMLRTIAERFRRKRPDIKVAIPHTVGTFGGIKALHSRQAKLARGARLLSEQEKLDGVKLHLFAWSPVVIAANLPGPCAPGVSYAQIVELYRGTLADYADLGCAPGKIYPVTREEGDSALKILLQHVPGFKEIEHPVGPVYYTTQEAVNALVEHAGALGYLPMASIMDSGLAVLPVNGSLPTVENVQSGRYPLALPLSILYIDEPGPVESAFIDYLHSKECSKIIENFGCIPASGDGRPAQ